MLSTIRKSCCCFTKTHVIVENNLITLIKKKKKIIPGKHEVYKPESELALIISNKLYQNFFDNNEKEEGMEQLLWDNYKVSFVLM